MNLHGIVSQAVGSVNPIIHVSIRQSTGFTTNPDFSRTPIYNTITGIPAQIQALQYTDLRQIEGLAITGLRRKLYLFGGDWNSIVRGLQKGGDLVTFPDGSEWLVVFVFEVWGQGLVGNKGWCSVCVTLQNPKSEG